MGTGLSQEVQLVRETLDAYLAPALVGKVMYAALRLCPEPPKSRDGVRRLVDEAMPPALSALVADEDRDAILERLRWMFFQGPASRPPPGPNAPPPLEMLDLDGDDESTVTRMMPTSNKEAVRVIIATTDVHFGSFLEASLGTHRIAATDVRTAVDFRLAVEDEPPLVVIIDAVNPPTAAAADVNAAMDDLPDSVIVVVWGSDTAYGHPIAEVSRGADRRMVLSTADGLDPLFDLVASRHGS